MTRDPGVVEDLPPPECTLTPRVLILALLLAALGCWWVVQTSVVHYSAHVGGSVPAIPAITALLLLSPLGSWLGRRGLRRGEVLLVYIFVGVAVVVPDPNSLFIYLLAFITVPHYFNQPEMGFSRTAGALPRWFAPKDHALMSRFYDAAGGTGVVDWGAWALPLLGWGLFFLAYWVTAYAALSLFRERWLHHDRLRFPIVDLVTELTAPPGKMPPLLRNPIMWIGFGLAGLHNCLNIAQAFNPTIPAAGRAVQLGTTLTVPPWSALAPVDISLRPEGFGIGYLMNTDVLFTGWATYVVLRVSGVVRSAMGYEVASTAYDYQEMAAGAYIGIFVALVWLARKQLWQAISSAIAALNPLRRGEPVSDAARASRNAVLAGAGGFAYMTWWATVSGMGWWVACLYFGLILCFAVVYSRIRAETGAPLMFLFPFWQQQKLLVSFLGGSVLAGSGRATLPVLAVMGFMARASWPQAAAYQLEAMEIGERARIRPRSIAASLVLALAFGLAISAFLVLTAAYHHGFNQLDGGMYGTGYRVYLARQQFTEIAQWQGRQAAPSIDLILQALLGLGITVVISMLRASWMGCPLHPLGFAMATSYGYHLWAPFLFVWVLKCMILRAGGMALYRRLLPFFMGIVLGHYVVAGVVWGIVALFVPGMTLSYTVHFA
jgi:hypothetical protein